MVVNNQQMQMEEDRPVNIGEMDFEFLTKNDPAVEPQDAALRMKKNLSPEEQKEIAGLVPYVERFFILNYKAETGDYPPEPNVEPEGGGGITIDEYRDMSDQDRIANSTEGQDIKPTLKPRSIHDRSPSEYPSPISVEAPEMEQPMPQEQPQQEQPVPQQQPQQEQQPTMMAAVGGRPPVDRVETNKAAPKDKEAIPAGPVGEVSVEGKDTSGVADDIKTQSDGFILSKGAVIANGKMYIRDVIQDSIENLNRKGVKLDTKKVPENAEEILISNGEVMVPDIIAQEIGYKRLEKMNNRGKELTEKLIAQYEQQQGKQQQAQLVPGFQEGDAVDEDVVSQLEQTPGVGADYTEDQFMQMQGMTTEDEMKKVPKETVEVAAVEDKTKKEVDNLQLNNYEGDKIYSYTPSQIYDAISKHEWKGREPIFGFVRVTRGDKTTSSAFGPAQIVKKTVVDLLDRNVISNQEEKDFANKLQATQTLFINLSNGYKKRGNFDANRAANTPRGQEALNILGISAKQFKEYVDDGYFLPSNQKNSKGLPPEILGDNIEQNYISLFNTVLRDKLKRTGVTSMETLLEAYHGSENKTKNKNYAKGVLSNLTLRQQLAGELK